MDNASKRFLALANFAIIALKEGDIPKAQLALEHLVHGDVNEDTVTPGMMSKLDFERGFKELTIKTQTQAMYIVWEKTQVIGQMKASIGGDDEMKRELGPHLQEYMT